MDRITLERGEIEAAGTQVLDDLVAEFVRSDA